MLQHFSFAVMLSVKYIKCGPHGLFDACFSSVIISDMKGNRSFLETQVIQ